MAVSSGLTCQVAHSLGQGWLIRTSQPPMVLGSSQLFADEQAEFRC